MSVSVRKLARTLAYSSLMRSLREDGCEDDDVYDTIAHLLDFFAAAKNWTEGRSPDRRRDQRELITRESGLVINRIKNVCGYALSEYTLRLIQCIVFTCEADYQTDRFRNISIEQLLNYSFRVGSCPRAGRATRR